MRSAEVNPTTTYLEALRNHPTLSHEAMVELFKEYQPGCTRDERGDVVERTPQALRVRNRLTEANLRLVVSIAKVYRNTQVPISDLIQEGNIGLMKAIDRFKWEKGYRFSTYATWWIRQAIGQYLLKRRRTIRLPAHAASIQRRMIAAAEKHREATGTEPTTKELTELIGASETVVKATIHSGRGTISLQQPIASREGETLEDRIVDASANPFEQLAERELLDVIQRVMRNLTPKEAAILRLRFGLNEDGTNSDEYPITEAEMASVMSGHGLT